MKGHTVYVLKAGQRHVLPDYLQDQPRLLAMPRDIPMACVMPERRRGMSVMGMDGQSVADFHLTERDLHVMSQVGYHFPVSSDDVSDAQHPSRLLPFRRGARVQMSAERPIASSLYGYWAVQQHISGLEVYELWRQEPAFVICRVPDDADANEWIETGTGNWLLTPGSYLIQELNGCSGRVVPPTFMVREFERLAEVGGATVEVLHLTRFD